MRGLRKAYGPVQAVDGLDLDVPTGEIFGLLGPNGAGKTTALEIIEGLREPDDGEVTVLGRRPWPRSPALLRRIGVQLQRSSVFDELTAREQLVTFADLYGAPADAADRLLAAVGLEESAGVRTKKLSGGQQQRLSIACAIVHTPELVFLDEPTAALDPQARRNLWDLIRDLRRDGATVVLTTHSMEEAEVLCDRVAIMDAGRLLAVDAPAALVRALDLPVRITLPPEAMSVQEARALPGVSDVDTGQAVLTLRGPDPAVILGGLAQQGRLGGLQVRGATLEDVFLHHTGREYRA
ncbi:MAG: ABC transporter ATP-binding protein [Thermoleophilia bacterium]